jgi:hypothetical protein
MPGPIGINVGGVNVVRPGVVTTIDASAMVPDTLNSMGVVGVLGTADGGVPGKVLEFRSFSEAASVLRGGPVLSYLSRIFSPSGDSTVPGAGLVRFVRIGAPTQATATIDGLAFTSLDYGRHTNGISIQVAVGAYAPWDVTIFKRLDGLQRTFSVGNGLMVSSTAATPKVVFDHVAQVASLYENGAVVATMAYPTDSVTMANLAAWIQTRPGWAATVSGDPSMPVRYMDNPVLASAPAIGTTPTALPASQGALVWQLANAGFLVSAALAAPGTYGPLSAAAETYLSGANGTNADAVTSTDWTNGLAVMASADVQFLFLCTTDASAQALAYQHVLAMRTVTAKRNRILFLGGAPGQTVSQAAAAAPTLPGPVLYVWNGAVGYNPLTGLREQLGGHGSAAQVLGIAAGSYVSTPATGKPILSLGLENATPSDTDIATLLTAGVTPITLDPVTGQAKVEQAITTWQGGANVAYRKLLGLRIQDAIAAMFRQVLSGFVGFPLDLSTGQLIKLAAAKGLDESVRSAQNPAGFLTPGYQNGQETPAWTNLVVSTDGMETWNISVTASPVGESDYITVAVKLAPAQISL